MTEIIVACSWFDGGEQSCSTVGRNNAGGHAFTPLSEIPTNAPTDTPISSPPPVTAAPSTPPEATSTPPTTPPISSPPVSPSSTNAPPAPSNSPSLSPSPSPPHDPTPTFTPPPAQNSASASSSSTTDSEQTLLGQTPAQSGTITVEGAAQSTATSDANVVTTSSSSPSSSVPATPLPAPKSNLNNGAMAGIAVGAGICIVILVVLLVWSLYRRRRRTTQGVNRWNTESSEDPKEALVTTEPRAQDQDVPLRTPTTTQQTSQAVDLMISQLPRSDAYSNLPDSDSPSSPLYQPPDPEATPHPPIALPEKEPLRSSRTRTSPPTAPSLDTMKYAEQRSGRLEPSSSMPSDDYGGLITRGSRYEADGGVRLAGGPLDEVAGLGDDPYGEMLPPPYARY